MTFARSFLDETAGILARLADDEVEAVVRLIASTRDRGGRLFFCGSGGGAGHASHASCDFRKLAGIESYSVTDNVSELTARINDEGWETSYADWLRASKLSDRDCVFVFSVGGGDAARGVSPNLVAVIGLAKRVGASLVGVVGRDGGALPRRSRRQHPHPDRRPQDRHTANRGAASGDVAPDRLAPRARGQPGEVGVAGAVIITRTPLRISLGGGGTDLPGYYRKSTSGGFLVAAAISKYVFIAINEHFDDSILLKYSEVEQVRHPIEVRHPLLREALLLTGIEKQVEISAMADIPAGTGLGSSGTFTVGLLRALRAYRHETIAPTELAEEACHVEMDRLAEPIGKQDQYIAAIGGVTAFEFRPDGRVDVSPVRLAGSARFQLEENLLLFYTGVKRSASDVLAVEQRPGSNLDDNLDAVRNSGRQSYEALEAGDLDKFGALLTEQWELKLERSPSAVHSQVDHWIRDGIAAGAAGGKLVGAGGGGFLLFYAENKGDLRATMAALGLEEVRFRMDYEGSTTIVAQ